MTTKQDYHNDSTPAEREAVTQNDGRVTRERNATTFNQFGTSDAESVGGRFKRISESNVVGSTPAPTYPPQPASSPWSQPDPGGPEFLGFSIDAHEPVGTAHEIQASLGEASDGTQSSPVEPSPTGEARAPFGGKLPAQASSRPRRFSKRGKDRYAPIDTVLAAERARIASAGLAERCPAITTISRAGLIPEAPVISASGNCPPRAAGHIKAKRCVGRVSKFAPE